MGDNPSFSLEQGGSIARTVFEKGEREALLGTIQKVVIPTAEGAKLGDLLPKQKDSQIDTQSSELVPEDPIVVAKRTKIKNAFGGW